MSSSVCQWSRPKVKVQSGAAPKKLVYTTRPTPASVAAPTTLPCRRIRSGSSDADTMNSVCAPSNARRSPSRSS